MQSTYTSAVPGQFSHPLTRPLTQLTPSEVFIHHEIVPPKSSQIIRQNIKVSVRSVTGMVLGWGGAYEGVINHARHSLTERSGPYKHPEGLSIGHPQRYTHQYALRSSAICWRNIALEVSYLWQLMYTSGFRLIFSRTRHFFSFVSLFLNTLCGLIDLCYTLKVITSESL